MNVHRRNLGRPLLLALALSAALALAGCSGVEGRQAQGLLLAADAAQAQLDSSSYEGAVTVSVGGEQVDVHFAGAGGKGNGYLSFRADGIPDGAGSVAIDVVVRDGAVWMATDGRWQRLPAAAAAPALQSPSLGPAAFAQLARHVTAVRVREGQVLDGRPVTVVAGEIDTAGLLASVAKLGALGDAVPPGLDLGELGAGIGDIEAVLTIDEQTHLLGSALVTLSLDAGGEPATLRLTYRLTSWNEPVEIPVPGA